MFYPIIAILAGLILIRKYCFKKITVFEYERGLKYFKGKFNKILDPGQYLIWILTSMVTKVDIRPRFVSIPGQEILTSDGVTLKVSLVAKFEIIDPCAVIHKVENYQESLYLLLQVALREIVGLAKIDDLLEKRNEFGQKLMELSVKKAEEFGVKLLEVGIKDIMFPGELKKLFAQIVSAQKEGLAMLEKTRGETAALRNLANAAKMVEENPVLLQLRLLQSSGNTIVFGMPAGAVPLRDKKLEDSH